MLGDRRFIPVKRKEVGSRTEPILFSKNFRYYNEEEGKRKKSYSMLSATLKYTSAQEQDSCGPKSDGVGQVL